MPLAGALRLGPSSGTAPAFPVRGARDVRPETDHVPLTYSGGGNRYNLALPPCRRPRKGSMTPAVPERKLASAFVLLLAAALLCLACAPARAADALGGSLIEPAPFLASGQPEDPAVNPATAPQLTVSGQTLRWTAVSGAASYVLARKVPGQADQYLLISGTSATPAAVPGRTVSFAVRTNVAGSVWSRTVSIAYPATPPAAPGVPVVKVSGQTLSWAAVSGASYYVLARKLGSQTTQYSTVPGTSVTPAAASGQTVRYAVRTNVDGSDWSPDVSIAYAAAPPPPPPPPPSGRFAMGVTAGTAFSYELPFITSLGAGTARLLYDIGTSASSMAPVIDAYARAGVRPLIAASFPNRLPSTAESQNVATWARAYGPGGTFWQGKTYPANTTVNRIEFGHETSYSYQWSNNSPSVYASRAQTYALRFKDAQIAVKAANPNVGLLAQGDNAVNQNSWIINMFRAVPDLGSRAAGWTIHPYGPNWKTRIDSTINTAKSVGSPDLPIWVTEWGLSTDNGRCLSDNYGYSRCLTYAQAASTLHAALTGMVSTYGSRLGAFFLYQAHDQTLTGRQTGREYYFGALQQRGQAKGAYTTEIRADLAAHRP